NALADVEIRARVPSAVRDRSMRARQHRQLRVPGSKIGDAAVHEHERRPFAPFDEGEFDAIDDLLADAVEGIHGATVPQYLGLRGRPTADHRGPPRTTANSQFRKAEPTTQ